MQIRVGIYGYGNLGKGVEQALLNQPDMKLVGVFSRRDPKTVVTKTGVPAIKVENVSDFENEIDVMIVCGGSATDLPMQTPMLSEYFNVVDSFDTHAKISEHYEHVENMSKPAKKTAIISVGWDPGMFSVNRLYASSILTGGKYYTFWGKGVSQGHSDAIRRIDGVLDAKQYTIPVESALNRVRSGENPELSTREKHLRECFVVVKDGADKKAIEKEIKTMPNYFADYDTTVHFISQEELNRDHSKISHGGFVICAGKTGENRENNHVIEYSLKLDSNPEFTASVLVAYARACYRLNKEGVYGCKTVLDIPPSYLSIKPTAELVKELL